MTSRRKCSGPVAACALCAEVRPLCESHVVSSFLYRWFKRKADSRRMIVVNTATLSAEWVQDGVKGFLLCWDCEHLIADWERLFSDQIFYPFHKRPVDKRLNLDVTYGRWLALFCAATVWRVLKTEGARVGSDWPADVRRAADKALARWKAFLRREARSPGIHELHLVPIIVEDSPAARYYLDHTLDYQVARFVGSTEVYVAVKLGRLLVCGVVQNPRPKSWRNTKAHVEGGRWIYPFEIGFPVTLWNYVKTHVQKNTQLSRYRPRTKSNERGKRS